MRSVHRTWVSNAWSPGWRRMRTTSRGEMSRAPSPMPATRVTSTAATASTATAVPREARVRTTGTPRFPSGGGAFTTEAGGCVICCPCSHGSYGDLGYPCLTFGDPTRRPTDHNEGPECVRPGTTGVACMADGTTRVADEDAITATGHPTHVHDFHQFLYAPLGRITVTTPDGARTHRPLGLWLPAGTPHSARFDPESLVLAESFDPAAHRLPHARTTAIRIDDATRRHLLARTRGAVGEPTTRRCSPH